MQTLPAIYTDIEARGLRIDPDLLRARFEEAERNLSASSDPEDRKRLLSLRSYVPAILHAARTGRVRGRFGVKDCGRIYVHSPPLQTVTKRCGVRDAFIPEPGHLFVDVDFRSCHAWIAAAASQDLVLLADLRSGDVYKRAAAVFAPELSGDAARAAGKVCLLAVLNGARDGAEGVSAILGRYGVAVPPAEGVARRDSFLSRYEALAGSPFLVSRPWLPAEGHLLQLALEKSSAWSCVLPLHDGALFEVPAERVSLAASEIGGAFVSAMLESFDFLDAELGPDIDRDLLVKVQIIDNWGGRPHQQGETMADDNVFDFANSTTKRSELNRHHVRHLSERWLALLDSDRGVDTEHPMFDDGSMPDGFAPDYSVSDLLRAEAYAWSMRGVRKLLGGRRWPVGMTVLVGPTGGGKSGLALQAAEAAARGGGPVLYVSVEMDAEELLARLVAGRSHKTSEAFRGGDPVNWSVLSRGGVSADRLRPAVEQLVADCPGLYLWCPSTGEKTVPALWAMARAVSKAHGGRPPFIVVDYLQRMSSGKDDRRSDVMAISGALRDISRRQDDWPGAAVLVLSSASRAQYEALTSVEELKKQPTGAIIGAGKESGEIEYDAPVVLVLATDPPGRGSSRMRPALVRAVKVRHGVPGDAALHFFGAAGLFTDFTNSLDAQLGRSTSGKIQPLPPGLL